MLGLSWAKLLLKELCEFKGLENVELVEEEEELGSLFCCRKTDSLDVCILLGFELLEPYWL